MGSKLPASLSDVVDRASAFSQDIDGSQIVQLTFGPADIEVFTERSSGKYQERIAWEEPLPDFSPITVFVDPAMVINGLRRSKQFYIHSVEVKGRMMNRIMVVGEFGRQLIQTVMPKDE